MMTRSKKRKTEKSNLNSKFEELIAKPMADFRKAIKTLAADEMAAFIEYCSDIEKCSEVYLKLIVSGELEEIKRLSVYVNLKYSGKHGHNAVQRACVTGRIDVLRWLVERKKLSLNILDNDGDDPVLLAIWSGHVKLLLELIKPQVEGGFGLSPKVRSDVDYGLDGIAITQDSKKVLAMLMKPRDQGGLGMRLDPSTFKMHLPEHLGRDRDIVYYDSETKSIVVLNTQTGASEIYTEREMIGKGGYGVIHEYRCGDKKLVLKAPHMNWAKIDDIDEHRVMLKNLGHEFKLLTLMYPDDGPYVLQQSNGIGKTHGLFSYRMIMPYIAGGHFNIVLDNHVDSYDKACILLRILEELQRIHDLGYIHGDIRKGNILVEQVQNGAVKDYKVRFIDFNFASRIGKPASYFLHNREDIPPEAKLFDVAAQPSYDVYMLAWWLSNIDYKPGLSKIFPSICRLVNDGKKNNPALRPELPVIIEALRADIAKYEANHGIRKASQFGFFAANDPRGAMEAQSKKRRLHR